MLGRTHLIAGLCVGALFAPDVLGIALAGVGSLLPDIDHPNSKVSRRVGILAKPIHMTMTHRGFLHSGIVGAVLVVLALAVPESAVMYALALVGGWWSHLALDALTIAGIPLFYPLKHRFSLLPVPTGGVIETLFFVALVVGFGVVLVDKVIPL